MNELILTVIRHGQTVANAGNIIQGQTDYPLDDIGTRQSELLARRLQNEPFDAIISSDLRRARMTAELVAAGRPVTIDAGFREWDLGDWQKRAIEEVRRLYPNELDGFMYDRGDFTVTGGESRSEFYSRITDALNRLAASRPQGRILLVTHTGAVRAIFKILLGISEALPRQPRSDNASLSRFRLQNGLWQLDIWNDTSHLAGLKFHNCGY